MFRAFSFATAIIFTWTLSNLESTHADVIEMGDLNIIEMAGNPSDGLRFLDMTFSVGLTEAAALANAQASYANARLATPSEFDDLFSAAGITYTSTLTAGDAFTVGSNATLSLGTSYDAGVLRDKLGETSGGATLIFSDPDGITLSSSSRDLLALVNSSAAVFQQSAVAPLATAGWLVVSDASAASIPEPTSMALLGMGLLFGGGQAYRRRRKAKATEDLT